MSFKEILYWIFFIALCFGGGYLHGSLPQSYVNKKIHQDLTLRIAFAELNFDKKEVLEVLDEHSDGKVVLLRKNDLTELRKSFQSSPPPDIAIIPIEWAQKLESEDLLQTLNFQQVELAPEFSPTNYYVPLFWDLKGSELKRWVLISKKQESADSRPQRLLTFLTSEPVYEKILKVIPEKGTLSRLESQAWPQDKKPSALRNIPFHEIKIINENYRALEESN